MKRTVEFAAGRELDALVAEHVMGWRDVQRNCHTPAGPALCGTPPEGEPATWNTGRAYVPRYSADTGAAWKVLEALRKRWDVVLESHPQYGWRFIVETDERSDGGLDVLEQGADAPLIICRAAVRAVFWPRPVPETLPSQRRRL
jgi:hypothetical protein